MRGEGINRARFLSGAAAIGVAGVAGAYGAGRARAAEEPAGGRGGATRAGGRAG